ncbi:hypothetical protein FB451DRAFT_603762 [Mycena latifolia]|nr:hypothetical protein FB451DRAFT_603762 [Mycena latifolia]
MLLLLWSFSALRSWSSNDRYQCQCTLQFLREEPGWMKFFWGIQIVAIESSGCQPWNSHYSGQSWLRTDTLQIAGSSRPKSNLRCLCTGWFTEAVSESCRRDFSVREIPSAGACPCMDPYHALIESEATDIWKRPRNAHGRLFCQICPRSR